MLRKGAVLDEHLAEQASDDPRRASRRISMITEIIPIPVMLALMHLALAVVIQIENFVAYRLKRAHGFYHIIVFFAELIMFERDTLMFCVLLVGTGAVLLHPFHRGRVSHPIGRVMYGVLVFLCNSYIVCDQVAFKTHFDHLRASDAEDKASLALASKFLTSFWSEVDFVFFLNILLLAASSAASVRLIMRGAAWLPEGVRQRIHQAVPALLLLLVVDGIFCVTRHCSTSGAKFVLPTHALFTLIESKAVEASFASSPHLSLATADESRHLHHSKFAEGSCGPLCGENLKAADQLEEFRAAMQKWATRRRKRPHVVLFVIESCGGKQLLDDKGQVKAKYAPNLAWLQQQEHAVTFPSCYVYFPSTVHCHVSMATGGLTSTQGSVFQQFVHNYNGSTLVGELRRLGYRTAMSAASDLDFEKLKDFLQNQGYDKFWHYGSGDQEWKDTQLDQHVSPHIV